MTDKTYKFRVVSTEGNIGLFVSREKAEKHIKQLKKTGQVEPFTEFRIFEITE